MQNDQDEAHHEGKEDRVGQIADSDDKARAHRHKDHGDLFCRTLRRAEAHERESSRDRNADADAAVHHHNHHRHDGGEEQKRGTEALAPFVFVGILHFIILALNFFAIFSVFNSSNNEECNLS